MWALRAKVLVVAAVVVTAGRKLEEHQHPSSARISPRRSAAAQPSPPRQPPEGTHVRRNWVTSSSLSGKEPVDVDTDTELPSSGKFLIHTGVDAVFTSPGYPADYPPYVWTTWIFQTQRDSDSVTLSCPESALGTHDSLTVLAGQRRHRFTTDSLPTPVTSAGQLTVVLKTSGRGGGRLRCSVAARHVVTVQEADLVPVTVNDASCGQSPVTPTRIIGGQPAPANAFPWLVGVTTRSRHDAFCGGSIISERFVLTAAHCVRGRKVWVLAVQVRKHLRERDEDERKYRIKKVIIHPGFQRRPVRNDISLLELSSSLRLLLRDADGRVRPVCLPYLSCGGGAGGAAACFAGQQGTVAGWGQLREHSREYPDVVHSVQLPILTSAECSASQPGVITENMMCTRFSEGGRDACQGDSGGPLVVYNSTGAATLTGLVSFGKGCGHAEFAAVYTRVSEYYDWIMENTEQ